MALTRQILVFLFLLAGIATAGSPEWDLAHELYQRTEYQKALQVLQAIPQKDAASLQLAGQSHFMLGDYKKAGETFEKAIALAPQSSELHHWMGRTWGRRAETGSVLTAPGYASKARQSFERAVQLDPTNQEAVNDLFDYYLEAPGILGGGIHKAEDLARHIANLDEAEGHYALAQVEHKRKEFQNAEDHLRRAAELAPQQVGRIIDVAKYLAERGRVPESDALFSKAFLHSPSSPKVLFARAEVYVRQKRNLADARRLLQQYLNSTLTPDDPPRERAEELLKQIGR